MEIGGSRIQAVFTGAVAGTAVFGLCALGQVTMRLFGFPMWGPPLGAASLIFASEATAAAQKGTILSAQAMLDRSIKAGSAVAGTCILAVLITKVFGASPLGRALAVASCSIFMTVFPLSGYFPPAAAFCALFVDQSIAKGALANLGFRYALFPCAAGTVFLIVVTRVLASIAAQPLRGLARAKV